MKTKLRQKGTEIVALLLCTVFFFWYLSNSFGALSIDEVVYTISGYNLVTGRNISMYLEHPPLAKYLIGFLLVLFGNSSLVARLCSTVLGAATIYLTFKIAKEEKESIRLLSAVVLGSTPLFASHSTMATLDIPLTFFVTVLALLTLKYVNVKSKKRRFFTLSLGVVSGLVVTSKFYGIYSVTSTIIFITYCEFTKSRTEDLTSSLIQTIQNLAPDFVLWILGFAISFLFIYMPYLPDLAGALGYAYEFNLAHMRRGHRVIVAGQVYTYPPIWTYLYWLASYASPLYIVGLMSSILLAWKSKNETKLFALMTIIPFMLFSLMPVKFGRYLVPILPFCSILTVSSIMYLITALFHLTSKTVPLALKRLLRIDVRKGAYATLLFLLLLPFSPLYCALTNPRIGVDSGYDLAANIVTKYAMNRSSIVVLSWYAPCLEFYIPPEIKEKYNITIINILPRTPNDNETYHMLLEGKIDLAVAYGEYPRFPDSPTINYVLVHAVRKEPVRKGGLYIYYMKE